MSVRRIRKAVREERYEFTAHAIEEMDDDDLTEGDVCEILLRGQIVRELTRDLRGTRFVIRGKPRGLEVDVVCRFLPSNRLAYHHRVRNGGLMASRSEPCEYCGEMVNDSEKLVTVYRQRKGKHFIFERVPARVCSACGERYFSAATVREMDRQMKKGKPGQVTVPVPIISLRAAS